jgi:hypothetical protein
MTINNNHTIPLRKPGLVQAVAVLTLFSGILNILWGAGMATLMTFGIVTLCLVPIVLMFGILPFVLGIFEIIYAAKLLANPPQPVQPSQAIAIMEICCILFANVISLVVGILALVFYNDADVKAYFAKLNGYPAPVATPAEPVQPVTPVEPVIQAEPAEPEKPKRARAKKASE